MPLAEQRDAPEHKPGGCEIMDRLEDRPFGAHENIGDRWRQQRACIGLHGGDDVGTDQRRRDLLVAAPGRIGLRSAIASASVGRYQTML